MSYDLGNPDAETPANTEISSGSFWPTLSSSSFIEEYRIPAELPESLILAHLKLAVVRVNGALLRFKAEQLSAGKLSLAELDSEEINGEKAKVLLYRRAVFCEAKAELLKETQTVMRKPDAENVAKTAEETEDKYREFAQVAIRLIAGSRRIEVELI